MKEHLYIRITRTESAFLSFTKFSVVGIRTIQLQLEYWIFGMNQVKILCSTGIA